MTETFAGIDVAASRPCTCVLIRNKQVLDWLDTDSLDELAGWIERHRPEVVAVDAPSAPSKGLLREPREGVRPYAGRVCDRELRRRGIPLYEVPSDRGAAPGWMEVGFQIYDLLERMGYPRPAAAGLPGSAIEVYPHGSFVTLLGGIPARKTTPLGLSQRAHALHRCGLSRGGRHDHDALDALVAALTARRFLDTRACAVGDPQEALIWLPVDHLEDRYQMLPPLEGRLDTRELDHLYEMLPGDGRDELLQSLLTAAPHGGEAMIKVLEQTLLRHATESSLDELADAQGGETDDNADPDLL